ncbi:MAG: hypothetical protein IID03_12810 [Candidatus Dadabacteria bacterium]|nr:hypothetical protein [Candidatus Dadabacteria bacterium]
MTKSEIEQIIVDCENEIQDAIKIDLNTKDRLIIRVIIKHVINAIEGE